MTTVVLPPRPPWVLIDLDTVGPVLSLDVPGVVQPPDQLVALVTSDEPMSDATVTFVDSLGNAVRVGIEWIDDTHLRVVLDTPGLSAGRGTLVVLARDSAGNVGAIEWSVLIDRPRAFDTEASTLPAFEVDTSMADSFTTDSQVLGAFDVDTWHGDPFETETSALAAFDTATEMSSDG